RIFQKLGVRNAIELIAGVYSQSISVVPTPAPLVNLKPTHVQEPPHNLPTQTTLPGTPERGAPHPQAHQPGAPKPGAPQPGAPQPMVPRPPALQPGTPLLGAPQGAAHQSTASLPRAPTSQIPPHMPAPSTVFGAAIPGSAL